MTTNGSPSPEQLREMYEYYVKVPKTYYNEAYLGLIRWLIERQEPAHTVGWPIVRTEFETSSKYYGFVDIGPNTEDDIPFDKLHSLTERDCIGLVSSYFHCPQGIWLSTNSDSASVEDEWKRSYADIVKPSVLFPCDETSTIGKLKDRIAAVILDDGGYPKFQVHCPGLFVTSKVADASASSVKMNPQRGVELDTGDYFYSAASSIFNLGDSGSAAFLHVFRLSALPASEAILYQIVPMAVAERLTISATSSGDIKVYTGTAFETFDTKLSPGEWTCILTVVDRWSALTDQIRLYGPDGQIPTTGGGSSFDISGWASMASNPSFYLGDSSNSAKAHHVYFAGWLGSNAVGIGQDLMDKFWRAFDPRFGFQVSRGATGDGLACWTVGGSPDGDWDLQGELACKYGGALQTQLLRGNDIFFKVSVTFSLKFLLPCIKQNICFGQQ